jgi:hypothetical protein
MPPEPRHVGTVGCTIGGGFTTWIPGDATGWVTKPILTAPCDRLGADYRIRELVARSRRNRRWVPAGQSFAGLRLTFHCFLSSGRKDELRGTALVQATGVSS